MRWIWIDKFTQFDSGKHAKAVKNCSLAEDHVHDLFPDFPIIPNSLLIEGMAQTGGILVGEANHFKEKVILAKIGKAQFTRLIRPGDIVEFDAVVTQLTDLGASIEGTITLLSAADRPVVAQIEIMFSHIDNNISGLKFPPHNFVFTGSFHQLLGDFQKKPLASL
jgi:3-hydroxyacyl-[acyl-carrier-protein] dehydratase